MRARGLLRAALVALAAAAASAAPACKWSGNGASNGCGPSDGASVFLARS
jgi:hypothetical protein